MRSVLSTIKQFYFVFYSCFSDKLRRCRDWFDDSSLGMSGKGSWTQGWSYWWNIYQLSDGIANIFIYVSVKWYSIRSYLRNAWNWATLGDVNWLRLFGSRFRELLSPDDLIFILFHSEINAKPISKPKARLSHSFSEH